MKLLFDQGRLYMAAVTEAHSEADDSIRFQPVEQLAGDSGLHVTREGEDVRFVLAGVPVTARTGFGKIG